jgi:PST family polysaccharide transporter
MKLPDSLRRNILALSLLQVTNYAVPLVSVPYLVRVLHPAGFGLLSFVQAVILLFVIVTDYGFNLTSARTVATCREDREALSRIFWLTIAAKLVLMLASAVVLSAFLFLSHQSREQVLLYGTVFLNVIGAALFPFWLFQGLEDMGYPAAAQACARILTIPAILLFVHKPQDVVIAGAIQGSVLIWAAVFVVPATFRRVRIVPYMPSIPELVVALRSGWHLFVANIAAFSFSSTTVIVLGLVAGKTEVGYFSAAEKLIRSASSLLGPVTQALYPYVSAIRAQSRESALRLIRRSSAWVSLIGAAISLGIFCLAHPIGRIVFGAGFGPSANVLQWLSPLPFLYALSNLFGNLTLVVFEIDDSMSRILTLCTGLNAVLAYGLSVAWGAVGASAATVLTALVMTSSMAFAAKRNELAFWRTPQESIGAAVLPLPSDS